MRPVFIMITWFGFLCAQNSEAPLHSRGGQRVRTYFSTIALDSYAFGQELFSLRSMRIVSGFLPFFITSLHFDEKIHSHFYDLVAHKNIHHPSAQLNTFIHPLIVKIPLMSCALLSLVRKD